MFGKVPQYIEMQSKVQIYFKTIKKEWNDHSGLILHGFLTKTVLISFPQLQEWMFFKIDFLRPEDWRPGGGVPA